MGDPTIDPQQVMTGNFGMPQQPQQPQPQGQLPGGDLDSQIKQQILQQGQAGGEAFQRGQQNLQDLGQRAQGLQQQLGALQRPKTSITDEPWMKMQPVTHQGFGGDLKNLLADIGRGALAGVASTGPGRSIQQGLYGGGERAYGMQSQNLAQQIADIQKQQETATQGLGAATNLATRQGVSYGRVEQGEAALMKAQTDAAFKPARLALEAKQQQLTRDVAAGKLSAEQARTEMLREVALHRDATLTSVAGMYSDQRDRDAQVGAVEKEFQQFMEHPILSAIGMAPTAPSQTPTPSKGPKVPGSAVPKKAATAGPPKGATHIGIGPDKKQHYADAQGNDLGLVPTGR